MFLLVRARIATAASRCNSRWSSFRILTCWMGRSPIRSSTAELVRLADHSRRLSTSGLRLNPRHSGQQCNDHCCGRSLTAHAAAQHLEHCRVRAKAIGLCYNAARRVVDGKCHSQPISCPSERGNQRHGSLHNVSACNLSLQQVTQTTDPLRLSQSSASVDALKH